MYVTDIRRIANSTDCRRIGGYTARQLAQTICRLLDELDDITRMRVTRLIEKKTETPQPR